MKRIDIARVLREDPDSYLRAIPLDVVKLVSKYLRFMPIEPALSGDYIPACNKDTKRILAANSADTVIVAYIKNARPKPGETMQPLTIAGGYSARTHIDAPFGRPLELTGGIAMRDTKTGTVTHSMWPFDNWHTCDGLPGAPADDAYDNVNIDPSTYAVLRYIRPSRHGIDIHESGRETITLIVDDYEPNPSCIARCGSHWIVCATIPLSDKVTYCMITAYTSTGARVGYSKFTDKPCNMPLRLLTTPDSDAVLAEFDLPEQDCTMVRQIRLNKVPKVTFQPRTDRTR